MSLLELDEDQQETIRRHASDWALAHGLVVRPAWIESAEKVEILATPAPLTLLPSPFPRGCFQQALDVQRSYNALYAAISRDDAWLQSVIQNIEKVDDFIAQLHTIYRAMKEEGYAQDLELGLFRSDYMLHTPDGSAGPEIQQVEFNTIASSFGGLSEYLSKLHQYLATSVYPIVLPSLPKIDLPSNGAISGLAAGLAAAHHAYEARTASRQRPFCVLFVVQDSERNIFDQRHIEYALEAQNIRCFRMPFAATLKSTCMANDDSRRLIYNNRFEVSVIYFRSGYSPTEYPDASAWQARFFLERSAAIKCPSIATHLAGSKKIQQVLALPGSSDLARFVSDESSRKRIAATFADIYPLDDSVAGQKGKQLALSAETSGRYVLKPQREGGGNNIYRNAIPEFLRRLGDERQWKAYILMALIEPPSQTNYIVRQGQIHAGEVVSEVGVYGTCLWERSTGHILHNEQAGYLLRTKGRDSDEGGVAAGFGAIDSVALVD